MRLTVVLSGPLAGRSALLKRLERAGCDIAQPARSPHHGFETDDSEGWITVETPDLDRVLAELHGHWRLRMHKTTRPEVKARGALRGLDFAALAPPPRNESAAEIFAELADLRAEINRLKGVQRGI